MKFLDFNNMALMLPAEEVSETEASEKLRPIFAKHGTDSTRLQSLLKIGHIKTAQVNVNGKPAALFYWRVEGKKLIIDTITAIGEGGGLDESLIAMEKLAHAYNCNVVEGTTLRKGMAKSLKDVGWYPAGIVMRKEI